MMNPASIPARSGIAGLYESALKPAGAMPLSVVQVVARLAVANVFWQSSQSKLASWPVTLQLFAFEYHLPVINPVVAAYMATAAERFGTHGRRKAKSTTPARRRRSGNHFAVTV